MSSNTIIAVDLGSGDIKALVCSYDEFTDKIKVMGYYKRNSIHIDDNGIINDVNSFSILLKDAIKEACNMAGETSDYIVASLPATDINIYHSAGPVTIASDKGSRGQVNNDHIVKAIETAKNIRIPSDHEIVDYLVEEYLIDNTKSVKNPLDMTANRLDINLMVVSALTSNLMDIKNCIEKADYICSNILLAPIAAGSVAVSRYARDKGALHIDLGASLTTFSVYQKGALIHVDHIPLGGKVITSDLLVAFMAPSNYYSLSAVDMLKKKNNSLFVKNPDDRITLTGASGQADASLSKEQFVTVVVDRLYEIFDTVAERLEKYDLMDDIKEVILTGGTARFRGIEELCKKRFGKPVSVGLPLMDKEDMMNEINFPEFVTAYGLAYYYFKEDELYKPFNLFSGDKRSRTEILGKLKKMFGRGHR